ncbi:MAG: primosomal protein N' [Alphaproteobacteria bacterium]|nr:primosomal protein N' [Alphaproteobacteria bacterium]
MSAPRTVSVLTPFPVWKAYTYAVPDGMDARPGAYVTVPLGRREIPGVVWDDPPDEVPPGKLREIIEIHDLPPMPEVHRQFIDWTARYSMNERGSVLKMTLSVPDALAPPRAVVAYRARGPLSPVGRGQGEGHKNPFAGTATPQRTTQFARQLRRDQTEVETKLWYALRDRRFQGAKFRRQFEIHPYITDFACPEAKLVVELDGGQHDPDDVRERERTDFIERHGFRVIRFWNNEVNENFEGVMQVIAEALLCPSPNPLPTGERAITPVRRRILDILSDGVSRRASEIAHEAGCTPGVVKGMAEAGLIVPVERPEAAPCRRPEPQGAVALSDAQRAAADALTSYIHSGDFHAALLDGVTGAGKTEVYFEAVVEALRQGRQALILLPEIALSNAFLDRFQKRFGCAPGLWHSQLSGGARKRTWRGVADGSCKVIVGARSALYLPYADLGLIVVDEEHDPAYKQEEGTIYNARDMAIVRASMGKIPVALVSATPSLETMHNVWAGRYRQLHLPDRFGGARFPDVHVIDMREDKPESQHFIAPTLKTAVEETLAAGQQALLFLNRRGYAPLTICRSCGHRMECPRCTAWLVEHRSRGRLQCHHCGFEIRDAGQCPSCHETGSFAACGPGVERIYEEAKAYWPQARILLMASDTADSDDKLRQMLSDIREGRIDIIVGTQIIAKGHHFPGLTCVGVIDADLGLHGGDLRATERTYQLLHQVAGRAGRAAEKGRVFLQTFNPESRIVQALAGGERDEFLRVEMAEREAANMPPFSRLAGIIVAGRDEGQVDAVASALGRTAPRADGLTVLGPAPAQFAMLRGKHRRRLLVIADKKLNVQKTLQHWIGGHKIPSTVRVTIDIDPQSFF